MHTTSCRFSTNIDCMKRFMSHISGMAISAIDPKVGDLVEVYKDSELIVELAVVSRRWTFTNGSSPQLVCDLHLPPNRWASFAHFTETMKKHNIRG
jgi:hypothetical protein